VGREVIFKKEPAFGNQPVIRGAIPVGAGRQDFVGFALDTAKRELHVDQNRNLDLTDDPAGLFKAEDLPGYLKFANVTLHIPKGEATARYVFDLVCYGFSLGAYCELRIRSGWQGDLDLAGEKWRLGAADNLDGKIDAQDLFVLHRLGPDAEPTEKDDADSLAPCTNLCLNGHSYALTFDFRAAGPATALEVGFVPAEPPVGTLRVEGGSLKRIVLQGPRYKAVLDPPAAATSVPAELYQRAVVDVLDGEAGRVFRTEFAPLRVNRDQDVSLKAGAPLTNCVAVHRRGSTLQLDYALKDAAGHSYRELGGDTEHPPEFVVRCDGREVAAGKFEYG